MPGEWRLQLLEGWFIFEMISAAGLNSPAWFTRPRTGGGIAQGERKLRFSKRRAVTLSPPLFSSFLFTPLPPPPLSVFSPPSARIKRAPWRWATERKQTSTAGKLYSTGKDPWTFSIKPSASLPPSLSLPLSTGSCQNHDNCWHTRAYTNHTAGVHYTSRLASKRTIKRKPDPSPESLIIFKFVRPPGPTVESDPLTSSQLLVTGRELTPANCR